jgi:hypothetical protein
MYTDDPSVVLIKQGDTGIISVGAMLLFYIPQTHYCIPTSAHVPNVLQNIASEP